jgi:hypothetical protein
MTRGWEAYMSQFHVVSESTEDTIDAKYDHLVREKMEEQLLFEPNVETKNRKPLRQPAPFAAQWEIRFGPGNRFRVLYDIDDEAHTVRSWR